MPELARPCERRSRRTQEPQAASGARERRWMASLVHVSDDEPGIERRGTSTFRYVRQSSRAAVRDEARVGSDSWARDPARVDRCVDLH